MTALPESFQTIAPLIQHYGYFGLFGLLFAEDFGVPVPGETMLIAAAVFAGLGQLNIGLVVLIGIAAAFAGDNVGFAIGRTVGKKPLHRYGKYVLLSEQKIEHASRFIERYGARVIIIARFIEGLRQLNGILAGISAMPWRRFALCNAVGAILWVGTWSAVGYFGGNHIATIERYGSLLAIGGGVVLVLVLLGRWLRTRYRRSQHGGATS